MFRVRGNPILEDELQVLYKLRDDCVLSGINVFHKFRLSGNDNIMTTCPFHKGGQERKPSFGISKIDGSCHCFACGWAGSLTQMISQVFGYDDDGAYGEKWLSRNFVSLSVETRKPIDLPLSRKVSRRRIVIPAFTEAELAKYRYIHPYMYERGLTDELIEAFDIGFDADTDSITFPCFRADGSPAFIARRSVKTKFFNYPRDVEKPVYAAERFFREPEKYERAVVCESVFNCLTCWKFDIPAVALLGTGAHEQYEILRKLPVRKLILGLDPDEAGYKGAERIRKNVGTSKLITQYIIPEGKDINDLDSGVLDLQEVF